MARALVAGAALVAVSLSTAHARAYCRESTCDTEGAICEPAQPDDCGQALHWDRTCIGFAVQKDGSSVVPAKVARSLLRRAFQAWESADCGAGAPGVRVVDMGWVDCATTEYSDHAGNANALVFRDKEWPHPEGSDNVALTTVTYDLSTGQIYDADIEVNTAQYDITTSDTAPDYDLLGVLTHEAGHFLGLAHSPDDQATMNATYMPGDLGLRTLADDDVQGICAIFPPLDEPVPETCDPIPRHGFSTQCAADQEHVACAASPGPSGAPGSAAIAVVSLALACAVRRRGRSALQRRARSRAGGKGPHVPGPGAPDIDAHDWGAVASAARWRELFAPPPGRRLWRTLGERR